MAKKILVVEDEKAIADILVFNLKREGYESMVAYDGNEGLRLALEGAPDLVLLDVMLPGIDGFEICRRVRETSQVPIVMLTAREEEADKIFGLELGADDYVTKPFSMKELMARVKANIRRTIAAAEIEETPADEDGKLVIDRRRSAIFKNGQAVELSVREFDILKLLSAAPGKVFSREQLMQKIWGYEYFGDLRAVDVAIRRLREKLEDVPAQPKYVITKRGLGYYFSDQETVEIKGND